MCRGEEKNGQVKKLGCSKGCSCVSGVRLWGGPRLTSAVVRGAEPPRHGMPWHSGAAVAVSMLRDFGTGYRVGEGKVREMHDVDLIICKTQTTSGQVIVIFIIANFASRLPPQCEAGLLTLQKTVIARYGHFSFPHHRTCCWAPTGHPASHSRSSSYQ